MDFSAVGDFGARAGHQVCSAWQNGNEAMFGLLESNPKALGLAEVAVVASAIMGRCVGNMPGTKATVALAGLLGLGNQASILAQNFFCGDVATQAQANSDVNAWNEFQASVPSLVLDAGSDLVNRARSSVENILNGENPVKN